MTPKKAFRLLIASAVNDGQSLLRRLGFLGDTLSLPGRWLRGIDWRRCARRLGAVVPEMSFAYT